MKIVICGDSFVTPVMQHPGTHFAEILQRELGAEMVYLGRGGMSNGGICLQLETAMVLEPDLIIFNTSFADRIEFAMDTNRYTPHYTVRDIIYAHTESVSSYYGVEQDANLIVDNLSSLLQTNSAPAYDRWNRLYENIADFEHKRRALRTWFEALYTPAWKAQVDRWCLEAVIRRMVDQGIPFLMFLDVIKIAHLPWFNSVNNISDPVINQFYRQFIDIDIDPGYHTTYEVQRGIAAFVLSHLHRHNFVK